MASNAADGYIGDPLVMAPSRKIQAAEAAVFLFLLVPSLALSLFAVRQGQVGFVLTAFATILRDLSLLALILFFLWRNRESVIRIGWNWRHPLREVVIGALCFIPFNLGATFLQRALLRAGLSSPAHALPSFLEAKGYAELVLATILVLVVAVTEETLFRGYLLLRFQAIVPGAAQAVLLSSAIFAIGHGYEGSAGLVTVGAMGIVFALVYLWRGSLTAPIVMHFLQDFLGIVLLPLLKLK